MRKTLIIGALAFVLGGGAVFIYLKHSAHSNSYATMHEMHHGKSGGASQGMMARLFLSEVTLPSIRWSRHFPHLRLQVKTTKLYSRLF